MRQLVPHRQDFGPKAPIVEALIDLAANAELGELRALATDLAGGAYDIVDQIAWDVAFKLDHSGASAIQGGATPRGFMLRSRDGTRAVQLRRDGFTMSHLRPYQSWTTLLDDARAIWPRFVTCGRVTTLHRIAVRFINRLELPAGPPLEHWLALHPQTPPALQQEPAQFAMQTVHIHPDSRAVGVVNLIQEFREPDQPRVLLFDIDCYFHQLSMSAGESTVWNKLTSLREFKNDIFFGSITPNTEDLFR